MRFDLGTLDSGERSLPFGLLIWVWSQGYGRVPVAGRVLNPPPPPPGRVHGIIIRFLCSAYLAVLRCTISSFCTFDWALGAYTVLAYSTRGFTKVKLRPDDFSWSRCPVSRSQSPGLPCHKRSFCAGITLTPRYFAELIHTRIWLL